MKHTFAVVLLLSAPLIVAQERKPSRTDASSYTITKYEWRASKQLDNVETAVYQIHHGNLMIYAECIGSNLASPEGHEFKSLFCSPSLPVGKPLQMKPDGHTLVYSADKNRDVILEVISEEAK